MIRHGQSTWNARGLWQGWADPPLSTRGEQEAREAAIRLAAEGFTAVVTSDLLRARRTAEIIASMLGLTDLTAVEGLREADVGQWSGLHSDEIEARWPGLRAAYARREAQGPPGGEPVAHFIARVVATVLRLRETHAGHTLLAVTHAGVIRSLETHVGADAGPIVNMGGRWFEWRAGEWRAGSTVTV